MKRKLAALVTGVVLAATALSGCGAGDAVETVTFIPTGLMESQQDATLMVSSGEQLDIMLTAFTSIGNLVDRGLILPLDDYKLYTLEELEEMFAIVKEGERDGFYMTTP